MLDEKYLSSIIFPLLICRYLLDIDKERLVLIGVAVHDKGNVDRRKDITKSIGVDWPQLEDKTGLSLTAPFLSVPFPKIELCLRVSINRKN